MAASAGGISALSVVLGALPGDLPAAILVVLHLDPAHPSLLHNILDSRTALRVLEANTGDTLQAGHVYVARPGLHLGITAQWTIELTSTALVNFVRPSADVLFESVAEHVGDRAVGVVLSGSGKDGADGVRAISKRGGKVVVQDEETCEFFGMPEAAVRTGVVDSVLPLEDIPDALREFAKAKST
jgi:two-component system, chemotaxis family, protein-glutamate methylesterase/glutaminase